MVTSRTTTLSVYSRWMVHIGEPVKRTPSISTLRLSMVRTNDGRSSGAAARYASRGVVLCVDQLQEVLPFAPVAPPRTPARRFLTRHQLHPLRVVAGQDAA